MKTWTLLGMTRVAGALFLAALISPHAHAGKGTELSASQEKALRGIARSNPATAIAMLFIDVSASSPGSGGTLHLEGLPTFKGLEALLDRDGDDARDAYIVFPRGPYSTAEYFVEVSWVLSSDSGGAMRLSTRTQLVRSDGEPLRPPHALEPPVTILVEDDTFSILPRTARGPI